MLHTIVMGGGGGGELKRKQRRRIALDAKGITLDHGGRKGGLTCYQVSSLEVSQPIIISK